MDNDEDIKGDDFLQRLNSGKNGFQVPEKYFEELPFKINAGKEVKKAKTVYLLWTSSVVAVCSIVLALFLFDKGDKQVDYYSQSIDAEVYHQEYLDQEVSEEDLIDFMINSEQEFN
ncbi:MAG: hypothetical protein ACJAZ2_001653 [Glaciecola sp.]|jgi:hypothetical protein